MRRLIILAWEEGADLELDWEGEFAFWEIRKALERAIEKIEEEEFLAEIEEDSEDNGEEGLE